MGVVVEVVAAEHVRTLEPHIDFALADATDFVRLGRGARAPERGRVLD